jgi:hypothetical protein
MHSHLNVLAVVVAALASYVLATIWYAAIFRKAWQRLTGITDMKPAPLNIVLPLVGSLVMSFVLYHFIYFENEYFDIGGVRGGLLGGFHVWVGFVAPVTLMTKLYERKPWGLWLLDNGFWLLALLVMAVILSAWM